jgi:hypothetical protein
LPWKHRIKDTSGEDGAIGPSRKVSKYFDIARVKHLDQFELAVSRRSITAAYLKTALRPAIEETGLAKEKRCASLLWKTIPFS